ncbi:MAG: hypothetical protein GX445_08935 [Elusimicrobia bacterium]|nr:hypothetical protein [Elusimicrobiota bacterium]
MNKHKSGYATGMAGEFFVMEKLYQLGYEPALTIGNAKSVDIFVKNKSNQLFAVSVKSVRKSTGKWVIGTRENILKSKKIIYIFLKYNNFEDIKDPPEVFVIPAKNVEQLKEKWLNNQYAIYFSPQQNLKKINCYKNKWGLFNTR